MHSVSTEVYNVRKLVLATLAAGIWVNVNEFLRNELLLKRVWVDKFDSLGLLFPAEPENGALWVLWSFIFAACIVAVARNSTFVSATALSWVFGFVLMWIVIGNLDVLPLRILPFAIPWSVVEVAGAVFIAQRINRRHRDSVRRSVRGVGPGA